MKMTLAFLLAGSLGLGCSGTGLQSDGSGGSGALGGAAGSGGSPWGLGGTTTGGAGGSSGGGGQQNLGGSVAGGASGSGGGVSSGGTAGSSAGGTMAGGRGGARAGGSVSAGGRGGANAGGAVAGGRGGTNAGGRATGGTSGTGGTICPPVACPAIGCLYGELPNPDPCGCPLCAPADAGAANDAAADACIVPPCLPPDPCGPGYQLVYPPCRCGTCVPIDAGQADAPVCPPIACPAIRCAYGVVPSRDPCGCATCAPPPDAGTETGKLACVGLDECACGDTPGCSVMAEACYCPFPRCGAGACVCGGGRYVGCAPTELASCASAKARVFALCPTLAGPTFDDLCAPSADTACITKCLNEVTSCSEIFCTFCEGCDCATDRFSSCLLGCSSGVSL